MRVCLFVLALVAGAIGFVPTSSFADIGPCNNCQSSASHDSGGSGSTYLAP